MVTKIESGWFFIKYVVHVIGLTQEVREEIEAYETLGVEAKYFHSLKDIGFSIGIEDGGMYKA